MSILNIPASSANGVGNTGISDKKFDLGRITSLLLVPVAFEFTAAECLNATAFKTALQTWSTKDDRNVRIYPIHGITGMEVSDTEATKYTSGYGEMRTLTDGKYGMTFTFLDDLKRHANLRQFNNEDYAIILVDENGKFLGTKGANGNVNRNTVTNCRFSRNGGDGLHVDGNDANVITVTGCDATNNEGNGFYDGAMMCNLYLSPHTNGNGWRGGKVTHNCIRWFAVSDSVPPGIEPGVSQNWQAHWDTLFAARDGRCLPATVEFQAWQPGRAYKTARPFLFVGNARHTVVNPYREDNQAAALFSGGTLVINGACRMDAKSKGQWLFQSTNGTTNATKQIKQ